MDKKVLLQDLSEALAQRKGLLKKDAEQFIRTVFETIEQYLEADKIVKIKGLGTFKLVAVDSRESVDVNTGERITIKGYTKISFVPDAQLRDQINKPFAHFETVMLNEGVDWVAMERIDEESSLDPVTSLEQSETESPKIAEVEATEPIPPIHEEESKQLIENESLLPQSEEENRMPEHGDAEFKEEIFLPDHENQETDDALQQETIVQEDLREEEDEEEIEEHNPEDVKSNTPLQTQQIEHQHNDYLKVEEQQISSQQVDNQHAEVQRVDQQKVDVQKIENQTVQNQHVIQNIPFDASSKSGKLAWWNLFWIALVVLLLMLASYFAGYYHLLCPYGCVPFRHKQKIEVKPELVQMARTIQPISPSVQKDTIPPDTVRENTQARQTPVTQEKKQDGEKEKIAAAVEKEKKKEKKNERKAAETSSTSENKDSMANKYAQLSGGKYQIIGTQRTHILKDGETLRGIAQRVYGSKNYVPYITVHNHIQNPDHIQAGKAIKLPELKLKVQ